MKIKNQEKKIQTILESSGLEDDEIKKIMKAVLELRQNVPRLSEKEINRLTELVTVQTMERIKREFPQEKHEALKAKIEKAAADIAIALVASGIWEILVYVSHHVVFHMASHKEDWRAKDAARAAAFKPTKTMSPDSRMVLGKSQLLFLDGLQEYSHEISSQLKDDPEFLSIARVISQRWQWDERQLETFFYQWLIKDVQAALTHEAKKLSVE
jgi:hypothetical protein